MCGTGQAGISPWMGSNAGECNVLVALSAVVETLLNEIQAGQRKQLGQWM